MQLSLAAKRLCDTLYHVPAVSGLFHTSVYCLQQALRDCRSVLDLGCGLASPLRFVPGLTHTVGVERHGPALEAARRTKTHAEFLHADIREITFPPRSFDAVILLGTLEHLEKDDGDVLLDRMGQWARKKVIVSCPNGFLPQGPSDGNPYQVHRSGWTTEELTRRGFRVRGLAGWKTLRTENRIESVCTPEAILSTVRFSPRPVWLVLTTVTQLVTYFLPRQAFELFCVRTLSLAGTEGNRRVPLFPLPKTPRERMRNLSEENP